MSLAKAIADIRPSIVQVQTPPAGFMGHTVGSGFVVGSSAVHVLTAHHVVSDGLSASVGDAVSLGFPMPDVNDSGMQMRAGFIGEAGRLLAVDEDDDLALIELPEQPMGGLQVIVGPSSKPMYGRRSVRLARFTLHDGMAIAASGFPLNEPSLVTTSGVLASTFSIVPNVGGSRERALGDLTANPGNSGGPVYDVRTGHVVGLLVAIKTGTLDQGQSRYLAGLALIVPLDAIRTFLRRNDVELDSPPSPKRKGKPSR